MNEGYVVLYFELPQIRRKINLRSVWESFVFFLVFLGKRPFPSASVSFGRNIGHMSLLKWSCVFNWLGGNGRWCLTKTAEHLGYRQPFGLRISMTVSTVY